MKKEKQKLRKKSKINEQTLTSLFHNIINLSSFLSETFWPSVLEPLKMDLPVMKEDDPLSAQVRLPVVLTSGICQCSVKTSLHFIT